LVNLLELDELVKEAGKWAVRLRQDLHRWPELGNEKNHTAERIPGEKDKQRG